jgi:transketolase
LLRAFNKNQILILSQLKDNSDGSISSILREISKKFKIPLSTLKLNARILKDLGLIDFGSNSCFKPAKLTELGKFVTSTILSDEQKEVLASDSLLKSSRSINTFESLSILNRVNYSLRTTNLKLSTEKVYASFHEIIKKLNNWHAESSLSSLNILLSLYGDWINEKPNRFVILSKGHASIALYTIYLELGIISEDDIEEFGVPNSKLQSHPEARNLPGIIVSTGSLGQGLSIAAGLAFALKMDGKEAEIGVVMGDGELDEGQVWEAAATISSKNLDSIIAIIDRNYKQLSGETEEIKKKEPLVMKWKAFGWHVLKTDNNREMITETLRKASRVKGKPKVIIVEADREELNW